MAAGWIGQGSDPLQAEPQPAGEDQPISAIRAAGPDQPLPMPIGGDRPTEDFSAPEIAPAGPDVYDPRSLTRAHQTIDGSPIEHTHSLLDRTRDFLIGGGPPGEMEPGILPSVGAGLQSEADRVKYGVQHPLESSKQTAQQAGSAAYGVLKALGGQANMLGTDLGMVMSFVPRLFDTAGGLMKGKPTTSAQDWWFRNFVDPGFDEASAFVSDDSAPFAEKAGNKVGYTLGIISQAVLTGGSGAEMRAAATIPGAVRQSAEQATRVMAVPAVNGAIKRGQEVYKQTGSWEEAVKAAQAEYLSTTLQAMLPLSTEGSLIRRTATGAVSGATGTAASAAVQGRNPTAPELAQGAVLGAATGGALGPRGAPGPAPTRAEALGTNEQPTAPEIPEPATGPYPGYRWDDKATKPGGGGTGAWVPDTGAAPAAREIPKLAAPQTEAQKSRQTYQDAVAAVNKAASAAKSRSDVQLVPADEGWEIHVNGEPVAQFDTARNAREVLTAARKLVGSVKPAAPGSSAEPGLETTQGDKGSTAAGTHTQASEAGSEVQATRASSQEGARPAAPAPAPQANNVPRGTNAITGLPADHAYESAPKKAFQLVVRPDDVDALREFKNDPAPLLKAVAGVIGGDGYHLQGDHFVLQADSREHAESLLGEVKTALKDHEWEFKGPNGDTITATGVDLSHGIGDSLEAAKSQLPGAAAHQGPARAGVSPGGRETETATVLGQKVEPPAAPSAEQAAAGNYKKPVVTFEGLPIRVENLKGSVREGKTGGKAWKRTMVSDYGYFPRTEGRDGDGLDVYMGPKADAEHAYVIDQLTPDGKKFDELKTMVGFESERAAREAYLAHYPKGWKGLGAITQIPRESFTKWVKGGDHMVPMSWHRTDNVNTRYIRLGHWLSERAAHAGWAQEGGRLLREADTGGLKPEVTGRTSWVPYEPWFSLVQREAGLSKNKGGQATQEAVRKAIAGEKLTAAERRHLEMMSDLIEAHPATAHELATMGDDELKDRLDMLERLREGASKVGEEFKLYGGAMPAVGKKRVATQGDLFGDRREIANEIEKARAEMARRELEAPRPEEGKDADLFNEGGKQTDLVEEPRTTTAEGLRREFLNRSDHFWGVDVKDLGGGEQQSEFRGTGYSGVQCTGFACAILHKLGADRVKVYGFHADENPGSLIARESGGHDFAVVDGKFIVDPWLPEFGPGEHDGVYDLQNQQKEVKELYGDREKWKDMTGRMPKAGSVPSVLEPTPGYVASRRRAYSDRQLALDFSGGKETVTLKFETRPDTTKEQVDLGVAALRSLVTLRDLRSGATVLGDRIPKEFIATGSAKLLGQQIGHPVRLAQLAQVYRDPRFETLRTIYTKGLEVVHETATTSRLPSASSFAVRGQSGDDMLEEMRQTMVRTGADGYLLLHNHPSGNSTPSTADEMTTARIREEVDGFRAHVVINHGTAHVIDQHGQVQGYDVPVSGWKVGINPRRPHPLLGMNITDPVDFAKVARSFTNIPDDHVVVITSTASAHMTGVRAITSFPLKSLVAYNRTQRLQAWARMRRVATNSGGGWLFAVLPRNATASDVDLMPHIFMDVATHNGESLYVKGQYQPERDNVMTGLGRKNYEALRVFEPAPTFYSGLARAAETAKREKGTAAEWMGTLRNMPGVKNEELQWTGLEEWLLQQGRVSKADVLDYIRAHEIKVSERILGAAAPANPELMAKRKEVFDRYQPQIDAARAIFVHAPTSAPDHVLRKGMETLNRLEEQRDREADAIYEVPYPSEAQFPNYKLPGGYNYRELLMTLPPAASSLKLDAEKSPLDFYTGHWEGTRNIVAHVRFDERMDKEGRKVLHLAEIQSDWHQAGRKRGYQDKGHIERLLAQRDAIDKLRETASRLRPIARGLLAKLDYLGFETFNEARDAIISHDDWASRWDFRDIDELQMHAIRAYRDAARKLREAVHDERTAGHGAAVPDAPFKTSWPELALKRMIRWAAEHGFDRLTWDTGETNAERYDLSQHLDRITWRKQGMRDGQPWLTIQGWTGDPVNGERPIEHSGNPKDLADVFGKEMVDRIVADSEKVQSGEYKGIALRVGGAGMRTFYDQILPAAAAKLTKRFGVSPQMGEIPAGRNYRELRSVESAMESMAEGLRVGLADEDEPGQEPKWASNQRELETLWNERRPSEKLVEEPFPAPAEVHSISITPQMRQAALGGFAVFEEAPRYGVEPETAPADDHPTRLRAAYEAGRRAVAAIPHSEFVMAFRKIVDPSNVSGLSERTASLTRASLGELAHVTFESLKELEHYAKQFDLLSPADRYSFIDSIEHGTPQSIEGLQPAADAIREALDGWRDRIRDLGTGALENYIENYFPHIWADPKQARRVFAAAMGRRPLRGSMSFLKQRTIPTMREGLALGLKPVTTNPLTLSYLKLREMQRYHMGVTLMEKLKDAGLARFLRSGLPMPEGWKQIEDAVGRVRQWSDLENGFIERGRYVMPEDAALVINNHLSASWFSGFTPAQAFRVMSNALNALQLGFSAFHLGFTTLDAVISKVALGIERLAHGEPLGAVRSFLEASTGPGAAVANVVRGAKLLKAYSNVSGATPEMQALVRGLTAAGGRVQMDTYFRSSVGQSPFQGVSVWGLARDIRAAMALPQGKFETATKHLTSFPLAYATKLWRSLQSMAEEVPKWMLPIETAGRITRASTAWIMEHIVPLQKLGVFADLARDHIQRNPTEDPEAFSKAMQSIWDSVDNRLGEMVYDNVFWDRTFKDALHFGVRAVGWNLGTVRELGGAPVDTVKLIDWAAGKASGADARKFGQAFGHKIPYALGMTITTAVLCAILTYLLTGKGPTELKDYFFPPTGRKTKYGTPERISMPSYTKDVYEYAQQPTTTVANKANPIFSTMYDIWSNEDFYGEAIRDPDAPWWKQGLQAGAFLAREAQPFALQGTRQLAGAGVIQALPYLGFTPAPARVTSPEQMNRFEHQRDQRAYMKGLQRKLKAAKQSGDREQVEELQKQIQQERGEERSTERDIQQDKQRAKELTDTIGALTTGKSKGDQVAALHQAGYPALAELWRMMPPSPRTRVAARLQEFA